MECGGNGWGEGCVAGGGEAWGQVQSVKGTVPSERKELQAEFWKQIRHVLHETDRCDNNSLRQVLTG